jgi:hypothetical protein
MQLQTRLLSSDRDSYIGGPVSDAGVSAGGGEVVDTGIPGRCVRGWPTVAANAEGLQVH